MKRYGVTPNMLVIPPQLALYMALAPDEKITYKEGGPAAVANFEAGVEGFTTRAFRGCGVVTSDPFEVSDGEIAREPIPRSSQPSTVAHAARRPVRAQTWKRSRCSNASRKSASSTSSASP